MIHEKKIRVRYAETGVGGKLKPVSILNYLQDITSEHTGILGASALDMIAKNLAWVVVRYQIDIFSYPAWSDSLLIRTWRYPLKNLYEMRKYEIYDDSYNLIITSKSSYILTSLSTKKPVRLKNNLPDMMIEGHQKEITNDLISLPKTDSPDLTKSFSIRMNDLDFNRHVNNSVYVIWGTESIPEKIITSHRPKKILINYLGESLYGDKIKVNTQTDNSESSPAFLHTIINERDQKEITRLKTVWDRFE